MSKRDWLRRWQNDFTGTRLRVRTADAPASVRRVRKVSGLAIFLLIGLGSFFDSANAGIVSVNFQGGDSVGLNPEDSTGVVSAANWYNATGASGGPVALNDSNGGSSGLTLTTYSGGLDGVNGPDNDNSTPQFKLFSGSLADHYGSATFTVTGLSAYSSYDLIVYYTGGNSFPEARTADIVASGSADKFFVAGDNNAYTSFDLSETMTANPPDTQTYGAGNYVIFSGLTDATEIVSMENENNRVGIAGFQVIGTLSPEPSSVAVFGLASMGLLSRRRLKRS